MLERCGFCFKGHSGGMQNPLFLQDSPTRDRGSPETQFLQMFLLERFPAFIGMSLTRPNPSLSALRCRLFLLVSVEPSQKRGPASLHCLRRAVEAPSDTPMHSGTLPANAKKRGATEMRFFRKQCTIICSPNSNKWYICD